MITHNILRQWSAGNTQLAFNEAVTGGKEDNLDIPVNTGSHDVQANLSIALARLQSLFLVSDQAVSIHTNAPLASSSSSGAVASDLITLAANEPLAWTAASQLANPFAHDVSALYITNTSGTNATVKVRTLQNLP